MNIGSSKFLGPSTNIIGVLDTLYPFIKDKWFEKEGRAVVQMLKFSDRGGGILLYNMFFNMEIMIIGRNIIETNNV